MMEKKPKILCVDDEASVLEALKRCLRKDFEVLTASSGEQALDQLREIKDIAILLTDQRMPGLQGTDLLAQSKIICPTTVRAIISGQIDTKQVSAALNSQLLHRLILKPWDNEHLQIQMLECLQIHNALLQQQELYQLAITDPVTQLTNHRYFQEKLQSGVHRAQTEHGDFSLIMIDVDHFKSYNDHYGHPEGDRLLFEVAQRIRQHCPTETSASRYGGEEFAVVLPGYNSNQAFELAEKLRSDLESRPFSGPQGRLSYITISQGVASFSTTLTSAKDILEASDQALYQAKRQGRNQTVIATHIDRA
jgi:diguanylate cyclase (GGDEF)-like protein